MESQSGNIGVDQLQDDEIVTPTMVNDKLLMLKHKATEARKVAPHVDGSRRFVVEKRTDTELVKQISVTYYPDTNEEVDMRVVWDVIIRDYSQHVMHHAHPSDLFERYRVVEKNGRYAIYRAVRGLVRGRRKVWKELTDNDFVMGQLADDLYIDKLPDTTQ